VGLIPGLRHVCKTRLADALPMLFFMLGLGLLYSMMFGNVGLIFRQRAQLLPWLLIIAVVGLERRAMRKLLRRGVHTAEATFLQPKHAYNCGTIVERTLVRPVQWNEARAD
jgi:hypothetical protein